MAKQYFDPQLFVFLDQLRRNNRRAWFLKHRDEFEELVRKPALAFITDLHFKLRSISTWLVADPKPNGGSLFRVYRDIRFSNDKTPYKTHVGMNFWHASATETVHAPGLYLHFEPNASFLAGGVWHPDARSLARIRDAVASNPEAWKKATRGLELEGATLMRPPRGYRADHPLIEDLKRKDFMTSTALSNDIVCGEKLMDEFLRSARKMVPLLRFLSEAVKLRF